MTRPHGHASLAKRLALACVLVAAIVGCAGVPDVVENLGGSAGAQQLNGPWQPQPMRPSAEIVAEADRACRADMPFAADLPLLLVDARGEGRLQLFYGGPDGRTAECNGIFVARDGTVRAGGAGGTGSGEPWPAIPLNALVSMSSGGSGGGAGGMDEQHVAGRAGMAVSRVHVSAFGVADPIEATVANGWWAAWWPGDAPCQGAVALAADGSVLSSLPSC